MLPNYLPANIQGHDNSSAFKLVVMLRPHDKIRTATLASYPIRTAPTSSSITPVRDSVITSYISKTRTKFAS